MGSRTCCTRTTHVYPTNICSACGAEGKGRQQSSTTAPATARRQGTATIWGADTHRLTQAPRPAVKRMARGQPPRGPEAWRCEIWRV